MGVRTLRHAPLPRSQVTSSHTFSEVSGSVPNGKRKESITFLFDDVVALARPFFDAGPVEHRDLTGVVVNQPCFLQQICSLRHIRGAEAEHVSNQVVRHTNLP